MSNFVTDESYSQMKNNIIEQSSRIEEILSHGGKFKSYYNELINNIITSMNTMIKSYTKDSKQSIMIDIFDGVMSNINFDELKQRFNTDIKNKKILRVPVYKNIGKITDKISTYNYDTIINMHELCDEDGAKEFIKLQKNAIDDLSDVVESLTNFENNLCEYRRNSIETMMKNVEGLYSIHVNHAKAILNKDELKEYINYGNKELKLYKGQKEFITNSLKTLLGLN